MLQMAEEPNTPGSASIEPRPRRRKRPSTDPNLIEASQARVRARKAAELMIKENVTKAEAMRRVGYKESTIKSGNHIAIRSEFQRLLNQAIPASEIIEAIKRGIRSENMREFLNPQTGEVVAGQPQTDYHASAKFCELYSKVFGLIARQDELKVTHEVRLADEIAAARERAKLAAVTVDATPLDIVVGGDATTTNGRN
jgi:type II secretory pathway component PulF